MCDADGACVPACADDDDDGHGALPCGDDCDDLRPETNPEALESCNDIDDDCDDAVDEPDECFACPDGFVADRTGPAPVCVDVNECDDGTPCGEATCENTEGSFLCACPDGSPAIAGACLPTDPCSGVACGATGSCVVEDGAAVCTCPNGFAFTSGACTDFDECDDPATCAVDEAGGICENNEGSFTCACAAGFASSAGDCVLVDACLVGRVDPADVDATDGLRRLALCVVGADCATSGPGASTCSCPSGFTGDGVDPRLGGNGCSDIDECDEPARCSRDTQASACTNTSGSFTCTCEAGFVFDGVDCTAGTVCSLGLDSCADNATCVVNDGVAGGFACTCPAGFTGDGVDPANGGGGCTNVDECLTTPDVCGNGACTDGPGDYDCACDAFFAFDGTTCVLVDACGAAADDCVADATCNVDSAPPGFRCACPAGFTGDGRTSGTGCTDVDECADPTTCGADVEAGACKNDDGSYRCTCAPGTVAVVTAAGPSCVDIAECAATPSPCGPAGVACTELVGSYACNCAVDFVFANGTCVFDAPVAEVTLRRTSGEELALTRLGRGPFADALAGNVGLYTGDVDLTLVLSAASAAAGVVVEVDGVARTAIEREVVVRRGVSLGLSSFPVRLVAPSGRIVEQEVVLLRSLSGVTLLKSPAPAVLDQLGAAVALSGDGDTLVVGAPGESSDVRAVQVAGSVQTNALRPSSGAVFVFRRNAFGAFALDARLKASNADADDNFGAAVAVSADGSLIVVGAPNEDAASVTLPADNTLVDAGIVYGFRREAGAWRQAFSLKPSAQRAGDAFGTAVALVPAGNRVVVGAPAADFVPPGGSAIVDSGAAWLFEVPSDPCCIGDFCPECASRFAPLCVQDLCRDAGELLGSSSFLSEGDGFGTAVAAVPSLRGRDPVIAVGAPGDDAPGSGVNPTSGLRLVQSGTVFVFDNPGPTGRVDVVRADNPSRRDEFGSAVALSRSGSHLCVGAPGEDGAGVGVNPPDDNDAAGAGAAYVYAASTDLGWVSEARVKAPVTSSGDRFGAACAWSADGSVLAVGATEEDSARGGALPPHDDGTLGGAGTVFVYRRRGGVLVADAMLKATTPDVGDHVGQCLALADDGRTLAVGLADEDSALSAGAVKPDDNSTSGAGAVLLFGP